MGVQCGARWGRNGGGGEHNGGGGGSAKGGDGARGVELSGDGGECNGDGANRVGGVGVDVGERKEARLLRQMWIHGQIINLQRPIMAKRVACARSGLPWLAVT
ncbi:hypothetical protein C8R44DRAFT_861028 [Mycena epipterygia]|nr:hypothetical protein C8R44DRAFT_861028 [Mycena epipterygia]